MVEKSKAKKNLSPDVDLTPSFEEALSELEKTIEKLEDADLTLDASLSLFEKGIGLLRICDTHLKKAQGKITELLKGDNGEYVERVLGTTLESFVTRGESRE
jgi:exodeoxyribonuclease VII small subunit